MLLHLSECDAPNVNMKHITGKMKFECWLQREEGILEQWDEPELGVHLSFNVFPQRYVEDTLRICFCLHLCFLLVNRQPSEEGSGSHYWYSALL